MNIYYIYDTFFLSFFLLLIDIHSAFYLTLTIQLILYLIFAIQLLLYLTPVDNLKIKVNCSIKYLNN